MAAEQRSGGAAGGAEPGEVTDETRTFEDEDARTGARADRAPTPEEEAAAPTEVSDDVARTYEESMERGANVRGEGQIET